MLQELLLGQLQKEVGVVSTRELALKLGYSWHIVQEQCLELFIKKKIDRIETTASHLWRAKTTFRENDALYTENTLLKILEQKLLTEIEKSLTKDILESLEKNIRAQLQKGEVNKREVEKYE